MRVRTEDGVRVVVHAGDEAVQLLVSGGPCRGAGPSGTALDGAGRGSGARHAFAHSSVAASLRIAAMGICNQVGRLRAS